jgi:hypothetical protein
MQGIIATEAETKLLRDIIAKALGYPKRGVLIGSGNHTPEEESVTLYYTDVLQHPSDVNRWALPVDSIVQNIVNDNVAFGLLIPSERDSLRLALQNVQELGSDWFSVNL